MEPANGAGSATTGTPEFDSGRPNDVLPPAPVLWPGCSAHWVRPDWPAIIAIAFGVDGPITVWWKSSNSVNALAYCQRNGIVLQSRWLTASSPICFCASVGGVVAGRPVEVDTIWPAALVVRPSSSSA